MVRTVHVVWHGIWLWLTIVRRINKHSDCYSLKLAVQHSHVTSVLLASTLVQIEKKEKKLDKPEAAIRHLKTQNASTILSSFASLDQIFHDMRGGHA